MGTNMAIWEHRIFLPSLFIFIFVLSLNCLSTKGVVVKKYMSFKLSGSCLEVVDILDKVCRKYAEGMQSKNLTLPYS